MEKLDKLIQQAFMDLADELEKECGDWQNLPDTEDMKKLRERIMEKVIALEKEQQK